MWTWITLGILVAVVVIGFLLGIVRALSVVNGGLVEAASSVTEIGHDADPLPGALRAINTNLDGIDTSLTPIRGQAEDIGGGLNKIRDTLQPLDTALRNASGALAQTNHTLAATSPLLLGIAGSTTDISGSLSDTTNILESVQDSATRIRDALNGSERADSLGFAEDLNRVDRVNHVLSPVRADTHTTTGELVGVNHNLTAICQSPLLLALPPHTCGR
jgi:hypothetical protein